MPELRVLIEGLLEDDSFPRAGATLAANPALLTLDASDIMADLLTQEEQRGDGDRAIMIGQFRAFAEEVAHFFAGIRAAGRDPGRDTIWAWS